MQVLPDIPVALAALDADFCLIDINQAAVRLLGYDREAVIGEPVARFMTDRFVAENLQSVRARSSSRRIRYDFFTSTGKLVETEVSFNRRYDDQGQHVGTIAAVFDMTEARHHERIRHEMHHEIVRTNQDLENLHSMMISELQQPVRLMHNQLRVLAEREGARIRDGLLDLTEQSLNQMADLINSLLSLLEVDTGPRAAQPCQVHSAISRSVDQRIRSWKGTAPYVSVDLPLPVLRIDIHSLVQVIDELTLNALRFSHPERDLAIRIWGNYQQGVCQLFFRDNGIGFPPELNDRVFEPLARFHAQKQHDGQGLGLARCIRLMKRLDGRIIADGEAGQGVTFHIAFPASPDEDAQHAFAEFSL
ncbi:MAG: PAS domain-containing sensor histidine kinase [Pseudomonadales bacterium]|nr:PAS domain-containing sensor histidine kinase [Pseudomonadales bacterium]